DPAGQLAAGPAGVADEGPVGDGGGVRIDGYAAGLGAEAGNPDPAADGRAGVHVIDDVLPGPRIAGHSGRDVGKLDAEATQPGRACRLGWAGERAGGRGEYRGHQQKGAEMPTHDSP